MEINITGLKCDNCEYRDDDVQFSEYKESIGKPCPECGESLLTQEDYDKCVKIYERFDYINNISNILKWINPGYYIMMIYEKITGKKEKPLIVTKKYFNKK